MPDGFGISRLPGAAAVVRAQVVTTAAAVTVLAVAPIPPPVAARTSWLLSSGFTLATLAGAQHIARTLPRGDPARRFWWAIAGNAVLSFCGYLLPLLTAGGRDGLVPGPATATLVGLGALLIVTVMLTYPLRIRSGRERFCFWLDMATVLAGAATFGWFFAAPQHGDLSAGLVSTLTGPVVMLVAVFAVAKLLVGGTPPFNAVTGVLGAGAAAIGGVAPLLAPALLAQRHGGWYFALSATGDALMMIATWLQRSRVDADPAVLDRRRRPYSVLPYIALGATYGLLVWTTVAGGVVTMHTSAVLAGAVASTALVVVRQLTAFSDNARLLRELDLKITELNRTEAGLRAALSERDELAGQLRDLAFQDSLTGLANRAMFLDRLATALVRARRHHAQVAVMLLDLDDFKPINDRFGHAAGDAVLVEVARRLRVCLRQTDTVARLGGDEFAVLLDDPVPNVAAVAARIVAALREPCQLPGEVADDNVVVGASVGVAVDRSGRCDADRLLRAADAAMYDAKNGGKGSFQLADASAA